MSVLVCQKNYCGMTDGRSELDRAYWQGSRKREQAASSCVRSETHVLLYEIVAGRFLQACSGYDDIISVRPVKQLVLTKPTENSSNPQIFQKYRDAVLK